ncbi:MAG: hypothetical protein IIA03_09130, partial [Proteobacteria bacterium]|nr:hypothetical protein [Pseudomonadota bacterium]
MALIDAGLRGALVALLLLIVAALLPRCRQARHADLARVGIALALSLAVQAISASPWAEYALSCPAQAPGVGVSLGDLDGDGLADNVEIGLGLDPLDPDSDDDGVLDGTERSLGLDARQAIQTAGVGFQGAALVTPGGVKTLTLQLPPGVASATVRMTAQSVGRMRLLTPGGVEVNSISGLRDGDPFRIIGRAPGIAALQVVQTGGGVLLETQGAVRDLELVVDAQCALRNAPCTGCGTGPVDTNDGFGLNLGEGLLHLSLKALSATGGRNGFGPNFLLGYNSRAFGNGGYFGNSPFSLPCYARLIDRGGGIYVLQDGRVRQFRFDQDAGRGDGSKTARSRYEILRDTGDTITIRRSDGLRMVFFKPGDPAHPFKGGSLKEIRSRLGDRLVFCYDQLGYLRVV